MQRNLIVEDILEKFGTPQLLSDAGGQKVVYRMNLSAYGDCVLKIGFYGSPSSLERINREVEILRAVQSEYFPRNYDFVIVDETRYFILEEYLGENTLGDCITNYSAEDRAVSLICELVNGLRILWDRKIVHRDLKPQNIIITDNGPRIIDLGIARLLDSTSITSTSAPSGPGTPAYASPEQIENRKKDIDFRSDQFNLGIIFGQLILSGRHPFGYELVGNRNDIIENILADIWARDLMSTLVSPTTFSVISRLLGHEPYQRFRRADELQSILNTLRGD